MQLDELKDTWKKELTMKDNTLNFNHIRLSIEKFDRRTKVSWAIELFACISIAVVVCIAWFIWLPFNELSPLFHLGMFAMIACSVFVGGNIIWSRRVSTPDDWTLSSKLKIQIEKREKEIKLHNSIAKWYLSPAFVAILFSSYGGYSQRTQSFIPDIELLLYWGGCIIFFIGIYILNRHYAKTKIEPILAQLYALQEELES